MPTIILYLGTSHVSTLLYKSSSDYDFLYSPYIYDNTLFSNYTSADVFYKSLLELLCKKNKVTLLDCTIYVLGFLNIPVFSSIKVTYLDISLIFKDISNVYPILSDVYGIITRDFFSVFGSVNSLNSQTEYSYSRLNKVVYPQIRFTDVLHLMSVDKETLSDISKIPSKFPDEEPLLFMDHRICDNEDRLVDFMYLFSLISNPGVFELYVDRGFEFLLTHICNKVLKDDVFNLDMPFSDPLGTLISTGGYPLECLVTGVESGRSEHILIEKNVIKAHKLLVDLDDQDFPLKNSISDGNSENGPLEEDYRIVLKSERLGVAEKTVTNGVFGLIFDTRFDKDSIFDNLLRFDASSKHFNGFLEK